MLGPTATLLLCDLTNTNPTMPVTIRTQKGYRALTSKEVSDSDLKEGFFNFRSRFYYGGAGALRCDATKVLDAGLEDLVKDIDPTKAAITVYHGLLSDQIVHVVRAVEIAGVDINPSLEPGQGGQYPSHFIKTDGSVVPLGLGGAPASWSGLAAAYYASVHIMRSGGGAPQKIAEDWDPKCVTFMWKNEIKAMIDENRSQLATGELATLMLSNYAMFHGDETPPRHFNGPHGVRHSLCWYMQRVDAMGNLLLPMLDDGNIAVPYRYRGTDLGHLCPPRCKKTSDPGSAV